MSGNGLHRPGDKKYIITVGAGKQNPLGQRRQFDIGELLQWLFSVHPSETWFSGIRWKGDHRRAENYEGADMVALDFDWAPAHAKDAAAGMPQEEQRKVLEVVQCALTPARIAYSTPRGMRLLVFAEEPLPSAPEYHFFAMAAQDQAGKDLQAEGISPLLKADNGNLEAARIMWAPNIKDGAFARSGSVIESEDGLTLGEPKRFADMARACAEQMRLELAQRAQKQAAERAAMDTRHRHEVEAALRAGRPTPLSFQEATAAFCARNAWVKDTWPAQSERDECPMCGGSGFSTQRNSGRWVCFSTRHADLHAGSPGEGCHIGNVLDQLAHAAGVRPVELLRREGLLSKGHK